MAKVPMEAAPAEVAARTRQQAQHVQQVRDQLVKRQFPGIGSIESVRAEIMDAFQAMRDFHNMEPDEIMRLVSGHSARLNELRVMIMQIEDVHREWFPVRTREIETTVQELHKQYDIASRLHSVRELDWKMAYGQK